MYVLSFRDMSRSVYGGVTVGTVYEVDPVDPTFSWNPANISQLKPSDPTALRAAMQGRHVCFIIHGFNVNRDRGYAGGGPMAQEFKHEGPLPAWPSPATLDLNVQGVDFFVPVLWPGDWYIGVGVNYPFVLPTARQVGRNFAQFLAGPNATMRRASFFTHSFGARVLLETLQNVANPAAARTPPLTLDTAVITAGAASETVLDSPFYAAGVAALNRIVVVSAPTDEILTNWFPIGNAVERCLWANDPGPDIALGKVGPVLTANSAARGKTDWWVVTDTRTATGGQITQLHGDYMPAPWTPDAIYPNGWSDKRERISALTQSVLNNASPPWPKRASIPQP